MEKFPLNIDNKKEKEYQEEKYSKINKLQDIASSLFNCSMGASFANYREEGFSGDGASLYTLAKMENENKVFKDELIKLGWGEFSRESFSKYPQFQDLNFDIYCLSQSDSYFASFDSKAFEEMKNNPKEYLAKRSRLLLVDNKLIVNSKFNKEPLDVDIKSLKYEELLSRMRNLLISKKSNFDSFANFLKSIPEEANDLWSFIKNHEADKNLAILYDLGINRIGSAVGDIKSMNSIIRIKHQFDFDKKRF